MTNLPNSDWMLSQNYLGTFEFRCLFPCALVSTQVDFPQQFIHIEVMQTSEAISLRQIIDTNLSSDYMCIKL